MAGKAATFINDYLKLLFQATAIANIADNASSGPLTDLYVSLHTADPLAGGDQTTHECGYTSYAREPVARSSGGFTISGATVHPLADVVFPACTGGSETATHYGIGTSISGAGKLLYFGPLSPTIAISSTVVPKVKSTSTITEA